MLGDTEQNEIMRNRDAVGYRTPDANAKMATVHPIIYSTTNSNRVHFRACKCVEEKYVIVLDTVFSVLITMHIV